MAERILVAILVIYGVLIVAVSLVILSLPALYLLSLGKEIATRASRRLGRTY